MATIGDVAREAGVSRSTVSSVLTGRKFVTPGDAGADRAGDRQAELHGELGRPGAGDVADHGARGRRAAARARVQPRARAVRVRGLRRRPQPRLRRPADHRGRRGRRDPAGDQGAPGRRPDPAQHHRRRPAPAVPRVAEHAGGAAGHAARLPRASMPSTWTSPPPPGGSSPTCTSAATGTCCSRAGRRRCSRRGTPSSVGSATPRSPRRTSSAWAWWRSTARPSPCRCRTSSRSALRDRGPATAVLVHDDAATALCRPPCTRRGCRHPDDISVVSLHSAELGRSLALPYTSVESDPGRVAEAAVAVLMRRIAAAPADDTGVVHELLTPRITERGSVRDR